MPYAHVSADAEPGGMFRRFTLFQRLLAGTKPHAPEVELAPDPLHRFEQQSYQAELRSRLAAFLTSRPRGRWSATGGGA
ncbi:MAG: hypothetical protein M3452_10555 [Chloroflexota bacterium]|nr:hypothetical protein [Chloroflexota bacterium]